VKRRAVLAIWIVVLASPLFYLAIAFLADAGRP